MNRPSREEAEALLAWGGDQNPGPWTAHCQAVARAAEAIAGRCGLDAERAYVSGLLHDMGYYANADGSGRICHVYTGYTFMLEKGYDAIAEICLTHSFPIQDINTYSGMRLVTDESQRNQVKTALDQIIYSDYDRLIQLCDCIGSAEGICTLERRYTDVVIRHGFYEFTIEKWKAFYKLKDYFDKKCGKNIYNLFKDEINGGIYQ
jgi:hypothetical protein